MARDPDNIHRFVDYMEEIPERMTLPEMDIFTMPDYDLNDEKEFSYYLRDIEKTVRGSFEYQQMVRFLRENVDMNQCSFFESVSNIDSTSIRIEIHHEPLSLYDICNIIVRKREHFGESLEVEYVAKEVMYCHYAMCVGLIPLSETVHELVHNQYLFIPNDRVFGNWRHFVNMYRDYMSTDELRTLEKIEELTQMYDMDEYKNLLAKQYIYVDVHNSNPNLYDVQRNLKDRINELVNGKSVDLKFDLPKEETKKPLYCPFVFVDDDKSGNK